MKHAECKKREAAQHTVMKLMWLREVRGSGAVQHEMRAATSHVTRRTSHVTRHTSHVTRHTSHVTRHTSHVTRHTSHVTRHTPTITPHTSHLTSHVTRHTSLVTRHTSHLTRQQARKLEQVDCDRRILEVRTRLTPNLTTANQFQRQHCRRKAGMFCRSKCSRLVFVFQAPSLSQFYPRCKPHRCHHCKPAASPFVVTIVTPPQRLDRCEASLLSLLMEVLSHP